jgi:hypothetical protein
MRDFTAPPLDIASLRRVGGQKGSNPAAVFEDEDGRRYYVKTLESSAHARNELLAARLYQLAGAPTLTYVDSKQPYEVATVLIELDKAHVSRLTESERRQAQQWFGVHAWTANWDAAGFEGDNQGVADGTVLTLDVGGALEFRAQGYPKGRAFGTEVGELERLRTDPGNPFSVKLFGDMTQEALEQSIRVVTSLSDEQIREVVADHGGKPALAEKMLARKADMARRLTAGN